MTATMLRETTGIPKSGLAKMKLTPMMQRHIALMSRPDNLRYFGTDIDPLNLPKPLVAVDLETPEIDGDGWTWDCKPTLWGFYTEDLSIVREVKRRIRVPYDVNARLETRNGAVFQYEEEVHREAIQWLLDNTITVYHNSSFDLQRLHQRGFRVPRPGEYQDTMLLAYQLNYEGVSLASLAPLVGMTKVKVAKKDFSLVTQEVIDRNLSDIEITYRLYHHLCEELKGDPRVLAHYRYIDLPFSALVREMEDTGFYLNLDELRKFHGELVTKVQELEAEISKLNITVPKNKVETRAFRTPDNLKTEEGILAPEFCVIEGDGRNDEFTYLDYSKPTKKQAFTRCPRKGTYAYRLIVPFNPGSDEHIRYELQRQGWQPDEETPRTETGLLKVDKDVLKSLSKQFPLAALLSEHKKYTKLVSTYTEPFLSRAVEVAPGIGHLRGGFNQAVTLTGRLSSSNPNLQNIPSRGDLGAKMRSLFIAKPGYQFVVGDDDQIEARIFADYAFNYCKEERLVAIFQTPGLDFHMENAFNWGLLNIVVQDEHPDWSDDKVKLYARELEEGYRQGIYTKEHKLLKAARNMEKTAIYGVLYGAGAKKLGNGDIERGMVIVNAMVTEMPATQQMKDKVWEATEFRRGYVYTMWGKRCYYPDICQRQNRKASSRAQRQAFNAVIQGSSGDRMYTKMLQEWPAFKASGSLLAGMVHDEYLFYALPTKAETIAPHLSQHFSSPDSMPTCPVNFKFALVTTWSEKG